MLDRLADGIRKKTGVNLSLPQVLEAGTWKAVRSRVRAGLQDEFLS